MTQPPHATTADTTMPRRAVRAKAGRRLVERAPTPDLPDERDRAGAQRGMIIMIGAGALFWGAVAAAIAALA